jgi:hypothetical protein
MPDRGYKSWPSTIFLLRIASALVMVIVIWLERNHLIGLSVLGRRWRAHTVAGTSLLTLWNSTFQLAQTLFIVINLIVSQLLVLHTASWWSTILAFLRLMLAKRTIESSRAFGLRPLILLILNEIRGVVKVVLSLLNDSLLSRSIVTVRQRAHCLVFKRLLSFIVTWHCRGRRVRTRVVV